MEMFWKLINEVDGFAEYEVTTEINGRTAMVKMFASTLPDDKAKELMEKEATRLFERMKEEAEKK